MLETSRVKSCLEGWREPVLHASSVLLWDKEWYPGVIAGVLTFKFLFIWWWDPTLLSLMATTGLFLTLADYLGPKILAQIFKPESWNGDKERRFEQVCSDLVSGVECVRGAFRVCRDAKEKKPLVHFVATLSALLAVSYVGSRINNFFLLYLVSLAAALLPGAHRKGLLHKYLGQFMQKVGDAVKGKDGLKKVE